MQIVAIVTGLALLGIGGLHLMWTVSSWPRSSRADFARDVVGREDGVLAPAVFVPACIAVAVALGAAAYLVAVGGDLVPSALSPRLVEIGLRVVAAVLLARGVGGLVQSAFGLGRAPESFRRLDLRIYSPLCIALGAMVAWVAMA